MPNATTQIIGALSTSLRRNAAALTSMSGRATRGDVRGIHRLRVATRRLREALPAGAEIAALGDGMKVTDVVRDLRRLTKGLGPVRELDVARAVLADFAAREAWPATVVARVDQYCSRLRDQAFAEAGKTLEGFDVKETRKSLAAIVGQLGHAGGSSSLAARLREGARELVRAIDASGTLYAPAALHEIRIAAKKLRYVIELTGEPAPGTLRRLRALQSALGRMHDAQVLQHRIQELAAMSGDRGLVATLTAMERAIEATCRQWHAKVLKTLPGIGKLASAIAAREAGPPIRPRGLARPIKMIAAKGDADRARRRHKRIA